MDKTMSNKVNGIDKIKDFFDAWNLYQRVIQFNYMSHKELIFTLEKFIEENYKSLYSMLDLGCGDSYIPKALKETNISHYHGIDLSPMALKFAKKNMQSLLCKKQFTEGNILEEIDKLEKGYDIIIATSSIHHFSLKQKGELIGALRPLLNPNGKFLMYDIMCKNNETRDGYIQRLMNDFQTCWTEMTAKELVLLHNHVSGYDFPEFFVTLKLMGQQNGFSKVNSLFQDQKHLYELLCFTV